VYLDVYVTGASGRKNWKYSPPLPHVYGAYTIRNNSQLSQVFPFKAPSGEAINIENEIENIDKKEDMKNTREGKFWKSDVLPSYYT
jgi:hypothetical protein